MEPDGQMREIEARDRVRQVIAGKAEKLIVSILDDSESPERKWWDALAELQTATIQLAIDYRATWIR